MRTRYASNEDIQLCRRIHKAHGSTYYYATCRFPEAVRWRVHGLYAFVRIADEWIDNPKGSQIREQRTLIERWRIEMVEGLNGERPTHPAMRVFCDAALECGMPVQEAHYFLDAMLMDLDHDRYASYAELRQYMRGSASAIGVLICYAMGVVPDADTLDRAKALGEAMQLTNFLRDIREDFDRGRIYLPQEDLSRFGVTEADIREHRITTEFIDLMKFEIDRARDLYRLSDAGIEKLPGSIGRAVLIARLLYSQILDRIEAQGFDVYAHRARTNLPMKIGCAAKVAIAPKQVLLKLNGTGSAA